MKKVLLTLIYGRHRPYALNRHLRVLMNHRLRDIHRQMDELFRLVCYNHRLVLKVWMGVHLVYCLDDCHYSYVLNDYHYLVVLRVLRHDVHHLDDNRRFRDRRDYRRYVGVEVCCPHVVYRYVHREVCRNRDDPDGICNRNPYDLDRSDNYNTNPKSKVCDMV